MIELAKRLAAFSTQHALPAAAINHFTDGPATNAPREHTTVYQPQYQPGNSALEDIDSKLADLVLSIQDKTYPS